MLRTATCSHRLQNPFHSLIICALLGLGLPCASQAEVFRDKTEIVVTDVMIEINESRGQQWKPDWVARSRWNVDSFSVLFDGEALSPLAIEPPDPDAPAPWTLVLYFDGILADQRTLHLAARDLSSRVDALVDLGQVEIVIADPSPRRLLSASRDPEAIQAVLSQLAIEPQGDNALLAWRAEWLVAQEAALAAEDPPSIADLASEALAEERLLLQRQQDALLQFLIDGISSSAPESDTRRALFWVSEGFDLDPVAFYGAHPSPKNQSRPESKKPLQVELDGWKPKTEFDAFSRTLAAFGWITFPLIPPADLPALEPGIGKLTWLPAKAEYKEVALDPLRPDDTIGQVVFYPIRFKIKEHRDPKKAEAYMELAESRLAQEDFEGAREALEKSIYHFADTPKTAERQALATQKLGDLHRRLGAETQARRAFEQAESLAEGSAGTTFARWLDPQAPLLRLAELTSGMTIPDVATLDAALASLRNRVRLTLQLPNDLDGKLHDLEVQCLRRDCQVRAPSSLRSSTPETVAAMRLRQALQSDHPPEGDLDLEVGLIPGELYDSKLKFAFPVSALAGSLGTTSETRAGAVRLSLARVSEDEHISLEHHLVDPGSAHPDGFWHHELDFDTASAAMVVVLVEHLEDGRFGLAVIDLF